MHWQGRVPFWVTLAVLLVGLRVGLGLLQGAVPRSALVVWLALSLVVCTWQVVGGWRAIDRHTRSLGSAVGGWFGYAALTLVLALTAVQALDAAARRGHVAPPPAPPAEVFTLPRLDGGRTVVIEGEIGWQHHSAVQAALASEPGIGRVLLRSEGGLVMAARAIAADIEPHALETRSDTRCYSACTLVFLAGADRRLGAGAELGFHQYSVRAPVQRALVDTAEAQRRDQAYLRQRGVSAAFVEQIYQAPAEAMWVPDPTTLLQAGVLTAP